MIQVQRTPIQPQPGDAVIVFREDGGFTVHAPVASDPDAKASVAHINMIRCTAMLHDAALCQAVDDAVLAKVREAAEGGNDKPKLQLVRT